MNSEKETSCSERSCLLTLILVASRIPILKAHPYVVNKAFFGGTLILETMDEEEFPRPMNFDAVKRYFS